MLAYSPPAQEAMNDLYHPVVQNGRLSRRLKESLLVAASDARVCRYCVGGHSLFLVNEFGYDQDAVRRMRSGGRHDGWTDAETALVQTVGATTSDPRSVAPEDIAALCHPYWSDDEIVEALVMASHSATTTVAQALHLEDDLGTPNSQATSSGCRRSPGPACPPWVARPLTSSRPIGNHLVAVGTPCSLCATAVLSRSRTMCRLAREDNGVGHRGRTVAF
jgi:alkylhydroperoxidase family enzyme